MTIHVTPIPSTIDFVVPAFSLAESNIAGSATTAVSSNSTLLTFDTTVPAAISTATVASATGAAVVSSRRDHVHGSTAIVGAATQVEMEAASSTTVFATPGRTQYHPGVAKGWCNNSGDGTTVNDSYNLAGLDDDGTGDRGYNWDEDFDNTGYSMAGMVINNTSPLVGIMFDVVNEAFTDCVIRLATGGNRDDQNTIVVFGEQ